MMDEAGASIATLSLLGGNTCLDFVNTLDPRTGAQPHEYLSSYADLVAWSQRAAGLPDDTARQLLQAAARRPIDAAAVLLQAIELREAIYGIFVAVADRAAVSAGSADLKRLNRALSQMMTHARIVPTARGFVWGWNASPQTLGQLLWPVTQSAADLLTSEDLGRVRACASASCGWLFLDTSKNRSRRWCSMEACGNRAKARRHYARQRTADTARPEE
jgi:predicted RNA-binding Zn ribbon-like protein